MYEGMRKRFGEIRKTRKMGLNRGVWCGVV
jgi:hypothetical protein